MKISPIRLFRLLCGTLVLSLTFGCAGENASFVEHKGSIVLVSIEVSPTTPSIAFGTTLQFTATGIYSDNSNQDLTASVVWNSSTAVATISNTAGSNGLATAGTAGSTTITATLSGVSGSTTLTVTSATLKSIQVTPTNPSIALSTTLQFTAKGTFSDTSTQDLTASVIWSSSSTTVATISNIAGSNGLATAGTGTGPTTITATLGVSGSTTLTVTSATLVSIQVTPANPSIANGTTLQFIATGTFSDTSTQDLTATVDWGSSSSTVATISNTAGSNGLATARAVGSTTITATLSGVSSSPTTLTVTAATLVSIQVTPTNLSIASGTTQQFTATGTFSDSSTQDLTQSKSLTWLSSDTAIATIANNPLKNKGLAKGVSIGSATITATMNSVSGFTTLTVN